jgi:hypothetical protein
MKSKFLTDEQEQALALFQKNHPEVSDEQFWKNVRIGNVESKPNIKFTRVVAADRVMYTGIDTSILLSEWIEDRLNKGWTKEDIAKEFERKFEGIMKYRKEEENK